MSIHPVPSRAVPRGPSRERARGDDARAQCSTRARTKGPTGTIGAVTCARASARGTTVTVVANARTRTRRVTTKATMRFSRAERWCRVVDDDGAGDAGEGVGWRVRPRGRRSRGRSVGLIRRRRKRRGRCWTFRRSTQPCAAETTGHFPGPEGAEDTDAAKMPGDPEMPDEEEEEKERKENPGEPLKTRG